MPLQDTDPTPSFGGFGVRLRYDRHTMAYMSRRTGEGLSKSEIIRCLKRYVAREVFSALRSSSEIVARAA